MKAEDLISPGDRAKRSLRIAQALAELAKARSPSLPKLQETLSRVAGTQPAVAMAFIMEYANRQPLHERGPWFSAAAEMLSQYRLSEDADLQEADRVQEYLSDQNMLYQEECERRERNRERREMVVLSLLVTLIITLLGYSAFLFTKKSEEPTTSSNQTKDQTTANQPANAQKAGPPLPQTEPKGGLPAKTK
jgi:hypothetical protein